jgi:hypothetical protein
MNISRAWRTTAVVAALATVPLNVTVAASNPAGAAGTATFVHHSDLRNWLADGERGLWIQAGNGQWFYARFSEACRGLNSTNSLVFDTKPSRNIDRSTAVVVPGGERCALRSFAPSSGPPEDRYAGLEMQPQTQ